MTIPGSVTSIGESAFESNSLQIVGIPDSVTTMGQAAFKNNLSLASATLGAGLAEVPASTFINTALTSIDIPANIKRIGPAAFASSKLESLVIPETVEWIGPAAFQANAISSLTLPEGMTTILASVFKTNRLTEVRLPSTLTSIGEGAFASNELTSVNLPAGITRIEPQTFHSNKIASVSLPEGLTVIGQEAFEFNRIADLTIPSTVTEIGRAAFGSNYLATVTMTGPAPTIHEPTSWVAARGSFGTYKDGLVIAYPAEYGADVVAGGYTSPTWKQYTTRAYRPTTLSLTSTVTGNPPVVPTVDILVTSPTGEAWAGPSGPITAGQWVLSVTEFPPVDPLTGGFVDKGWVCTVDGVPVDGFVGADGTITVAAETAVSCEHTYEYVAPTHGELNLSAVVEGGPLDASAVTFTVTDADGIARPGLPTQSVSGGTYVLSAAINSIVDLGGTYSAQGWACTADGVAVADAVSASGELTVAPGSSVACVHTFAFTANPVNPANPGTPGSNGQGGQTGSDGSGGGNAASAANTTGTAVHAKQPSAALARTGTDMTVTALIVAQLLVLGGATLVLRRSWANR